MSVHYLKSGVQAARVRPGLSALLYAVNLAMGLILSVPIMIAVSQAVSESGYSPDLSQNFDMALWADILEESGPLMQSVTAQMLWMIPLLFLWKIAQSVGLIEALGRGGGGSFWKGVGLHTGRAFLLGLLFLVPVGAVVVVILIVAFLLSLVLTGEAGTFWVWFVFTPLASLIAIALVDMMHDFGRMELILSEKDIMDSWFAGLKWPMISGTANSIYIGWMVSGALILIFPLLLNMGLAGIFLAFITQQIALFLRAAVSVSWIGSEVHFFEDSMAAMEPVIARAESA